MSSLFVEFLLVLGPGVLSSLILSKLTHKIYTFWQFVTSALAFDLVIYVFTLAILIMMGLSGDLFVSGALSTVLVSLTYGVVSLAAAFLFPFVIALFSSIRIGKQK